MRRHQLSFFPPFAVAVFDKPKGDLTKMPKANSRRENVLRQVIKAKRRGITGEELAGKLPGMTQPQISKAILELLEGGFIMDSTTTRPTTFGDPTFVWRTADYGIEMWQKVGRK